MENNSQLNRLGSYATSQQEHAESNYLSAVHRGQPISMAQPIRQAPQANSTYNATNSGDTGLVVDGVQGSARLSKQSEVSFLNEVQALIDQPLADHVKMALEVAIQQRAFQQPVIRSQVITTKDQGGSDKKRRANTKMQQIPIFECDIYKCEASFKTKFSLQRHYKKHYSKKEIKCRFCAKTFCLPQYKEEHEYTHTGEKPFVCSTCPLSFRQRGKLSHHRKNCPNRPSSNEHQSAHCETYNNIQQQSQQAMLSMQNLLSNPFRGPFNLNTSQDYQNRMGQNQTSIRSVNHLQSHEADNANRYPTSQQVSDQNAASNNLRMNAFDYNDQNRRPLNRQISTTHSSSRRPMFYDELDSRPAQGGQASPLKLRQPQSLYHGGPTSSNGMPASQSRYLKNSVQQQEAVNQQSSSQAQQQQKPAQITTQQNKSQSNNLHTDSTNFRLYENWGGVQNNKQAGYQGRDSLDQQREANGPQSMAQPKPQNQSESQGLRYQTLSSFYEPNKQQEQRVYNKPSQQSLYIQQQQQNQAADRSRQASQQQMISLQQMTNVGDQLSDENLQIILTQQRQARQKSNLQYDKPE